MYRVKRLRRLTPRKLHQKGLAADVLKFANQVNTDFLDSPQLLLHFLYGFINLLQCRPIHYTPSSKKTIQPIKLWLMKLKSMLLFKIISINVVSP